MHKQLSYEVLRPGFVAGAWCDKGSVVHLTEREARYMVLSGQLGLKPQDEAAKAKGKK